MEYFSVRDVAHRINKSEETVKRYLRDGMFPNAYKKSDKQGWRIPEFDLRETTSFPLLQEEQLSIDSPIIDNPTEDDIEELIILAYQATTLTYPSEELLRLFNKAGLRRSLEILVVLRQSENKVRNPLGFIKTALKEGWTPNTLPKKIDRRRKNLEEQNVMETPSLPNGFPYFNWLESEE